MATTKALELAQLADQITVDESNDIVEVGTISPDKIVQGSGSALPTSKPSLLLDFANSNNVDPTISFSRSSTATYWGKEKVKAEQNLIPHSKDFSASTWTNYGPVVSYQSAVVAPDGSSGVYLITAGAANTFQYIRHATGLFNTGMMVASLYVKNVNSPYITLNIENWSSRFSYIIFDTSTNTISATGDNDNYQNTVGSVEDAGNGWYRLVLVTDHFRHTTSGDIRAGLGPSNDGVASTFGSDVFAGSGESFYAWGFQLEYRDTVTEFTETEGSRITNYLRKLETASLNTPRLEYDPITNQRKGLLIEEGRTNLEVNSEDFTQWSKSLSGIDISSNVIVTLDGTVTGDKIKKTESTAHLSSTVTVVSGDEITISVFAKADTLNWLAIRTISGTADQDYFYFDLVNGVIGASSIGGQNIENCGNGWFRCSVTVTANDVSLNYRLYPVLGDENAGGTGNIYLWGAQVESGSFPTSYIKTEASQVTRSQETAILAATDWHNVEEGAILFAGSFSLGTDDSTTDNRLFTLSDNSVYNDIGVEFTSAGNIKMSSIQGSLSMDEEASWSPATNMFKTALSYDVNNFILTLNGSTVATSNSAPVPVVNTLNIGANYNSTASVMNGHIRKIAYYSEALSELELRTLSEI